MGLDSHSGVLRVREALKERGFEPEIVELERTARSAAAAADALGVRVEQIVKSLVFRGRRTGRPSSSSPAAPTGLTRTRSPASSPSRSR